MSRIDDLISNYQRLTRLPWPTGLAPAQRVWMAVYSPDDERRLRLHLQEFDTASKAAGHEWALIDITNAFEKWMASHEYREAYFESPDDLQMKLDAEFSDYVAARIRSVLARADVTDNSVVAVLGVGSLFGFARVSQVLKLVEGDVKGRLVVFFPGQFEQNNYRLLDARDGWNYMAVPISIHGAGGAS